MGEFAGRVVKSIKGAQGGICCLVENDGADVAHSVRCPHACLELTHTTPLFDLARNSKPSRIFKQLSSALLHMYWRPFPISRRHWSSQKQKPLELRERRRPMVSYILPMHGARQPIQAYLLKHTCQCRVHYHCGEFLKASARVFVA